MDGYISREAVFQVVHGVARGIANRDIEAFKAKDMKAFYKAKGAKEILDSVDTDLSYIPTADVQSVVCCKDCKYAQNPNDTMVYCTYFECGTMSQNDFCSQGERRTENGRT